jgi:hypothetical protein
MGTADWLAVAVALLDALLGVVLVRACKRR